MGRPLIELEWDIVDEMITCGCPGTEIAAAFDICAETFYLKVQEKWGIKFTEYLQSKASKGNFLLRKKQFEEAMSGNTTLLIWLGKTRLAQTDKAEVSDEVHKKMMEYIPLLQKMMERNPVKE